MIGGRGEVLINAVRFSSIHCVLVTDIGYRYGMSDDAAATAAGRIRPLQGWLLAVSGRQRAVSSKR